MSLEEACLFAQAFLLKDGQEENGLLLKHFYLIKMKRNVQ